MIFGQIYAQKGSIRGVIHDEGTGETLIGANVIVQETSPIIGATTDFDGKYSIDNLAPGTYTIQCSYISFQSKTIENITVKSGEVTLINFSMAENSQDIEEIVVSAEAVKNTESAVLTIQRKSPLVVNGISAQQISKLGDSDAASALKRVSGISIQDGKYVYVRGLSDRYSKITLNGAEIPGLDPNKNTVQMDLFPSNLFENMMVYKTFSPDLPASFTGGHVDVTTKDFPEKFMFRFSTSLGYNTNAHLRDDYIAYQGGSLDFLAMDDGTRNVPDAASNGIPSLYTDNNELDNISSQFNNKMAADKKPSYLNHSHSVSVGNQVNFLGKKLGFLASLSYSHKYKMYEDGAYARYNLVGTTPENGLMNLYIKEKDTRSEENVIIAGLFNLSYKLNNNNKIGLNILRNQGGMSSARFKEGPKPEDDMYMYENFLGYLERGFTSYQLKGKHVLPNLNGITVEWLSSYTDSKQDEPDMRFFNYNRKGDNFEISPNAYPVPARFYREMSESNFDNKIHVSVPFKIRGDKGKFKFGGAYVMKNRNSDERKFDIASQGLPFNGSIEEYLSPENLGQNAISADVTYGYYYENDIRNDKINSYQAEHSVAAGYLMVDLPIGSRFKVVTGARLESSYMFTENKVDKYHVKYAKGEKSNLDILPAINATFELTDMMNLRAAYTRTLARPAFKEFAPYNPYDFSKGWRYVGNPDLERTLIDNIDFRWENFMNQGEVISVSIFYKFFYNPIEVVDAPQANNAEFHYKNSKSSEIWGAEIEMRKKMNEAGFLSDFFFGFNLTYVNSEVEVPDSIYDVAILTNPETDKTRPLSGQAPYIVNAFINYDNKDIGLSSNLSFNVSGRKLITITKGGTPNIYEEAFPSLNYNISKNIGDKINLSFSVSNILDSETKRTYTYQEKEYIFQRYSYGRTFSFGFTYFIN